LEFFYIWNILVLAKSRNVPAGRQATFQPNMRELVLFTLGDTRYGIWRDQILSVESVQSLHRLPFARSSLTVLSVFGGQTQTLADLPLCLGHPATSDARGASAWILSEQESIRGFLVSGESVSVRVSPETLIRAPDFLRPLPIEGFFSHDALPVPVLDVSALYERVRRAERERAAPPLALNAPPTRQSHPAAWFRVFASSGSLFAAPGTDIAELTMSGREVARIPLLPPNIAGVALSRDRVLPVVDLALRVSGKKTRENSRILEATLNGTALGFLIDEDKGEWAAADVMVKDLPLVLRAPWMSSAVLRGAHIAPLIELGALLSGPARSAGGSPPPPSHSPDSRFPAVFGHQAVEVTEFKALGTIFAVPQSEVADVLPCQPFQEFPLAAGLVAGLADYTGELVPVLDLARIDGEPPQRTADWRMIVLKNGDFRALILCESARAARTLEREVQRGVPVVLPFPVVYGCYTDGEAVRLVLNIEELTVHYHQSGAALLLPALTVAVGESRIRARVTHDVREPAPPAMPPTEPAVITHDVKEPVPPARDSTRPAAEDEPLPEPPPPSEPPLPAELVLSSLEPSPAEPAPTEPVPMEPGPVAEEQVPAESPPSIGDEEIFEPVHQVEATAQPTPALAGSEPKRRDEKPPSQARKPVPFRGRAVRRVLFAAAVVILLAASVIAGLHFGIFRPRPAAPAATKQEITTSPDSSSRPADTLYVVKQGDTLWDIAARFTGDPHNFRSLAAYNRIVNPDLISPGQVIRLPR